MEITSVSRRARRQRAGTSRIEPIEPLELIEPLERRLLLATVPPGFTDAQVAANLTSPTAMALAPDGRVFVAQQNGVIRVIKNGQLLATPFTTITNINFEMERGLVGITFDPNFATNNYVYVYYTVQNPNRHNRLSRLVANGDVSSGSETILVEFPDLQGAVWHMGGALHFAPDGKLMVAVGDHQQSASAQSLSNVFGKILRFNPDGTIPTDNPFYTQTSGQARAIWARGLRNPFTFGIQPGTGRVFINDVGQETYEEINDGAPGANYGWPTSEGPNNTGGFNAPFYYYSHSSGPGCAITGGSFYNPPNSQFPSSYVGKYFFADLCGGWIRTIDPTTKAVTGFATGTSSVVDVDVASDGTLYYLQRGPSSTQGSVRKVTHASPAIPSITSHPQNQTAAIGESVTFSVTASGQQPLSYQWQRRSAGAPGFSNIAGATSSSYTINSVASADHDARFRVVVSNTAGQVTSNEAVLTITNNAAPLATITAPTEGTMFRAGDTIDYAGTGTDPEDGTLPASAFTWQVDFYTNNIPRPFLPPTSGQTSGSFTIPTTGPYKREDVFYRIMLTVRDSGGRTHTTTRDILPHVSTVTLDTNIPGLGLLLDDQTVTTPHTFMGVVGFERELEAPLVQTVNSVTYEFVSWSDGGAATHVISTPEDDTTYIATYRAATFAYVGDLPWISATNGWGPVERNMSNGEQGAGDGLPIRLNGVTYPKGLGVHALSDVRFNLGGNYSRFISDVGVDDEVGSAGSIVFQVFGDSPTPLFTSPVMNGNSATVNINLDVTGVQTLRLVVGDAGNGINSDHGDWADARIVARPLAVTQSGFHFATAPHALTFTFDANVSASLALEDLVVRNLTTGTDIAREAMALAYDASTNTATITFPGLTNGILPDGNYRATILAAGVVSNTGNALPADHVFNFFHLTGDANHDRTVNLQDFNILASNFGEDDHDFTEGDFNYDGVVNLVDFNYLASKFGTSV